MIITGQALTQAQVVADFTKVLVLTLAQAAVDITTTAPVQLAALYITPPTTQVTLVHQNNQHYSHRLEIDTSVNQKSLFYLLCIKMLISIIWLLIDY
jgi:hypothetical protein